MASQSYVMREQARDKVPDIMREPQPAPMVTRPSLLALALLLAAFNLMAVYGT